MVCLSRSYHFKFFKCCLPQILFGPFLNTLTYIFFDAVFYSSKSPLVHAPSMVLRLFLHGYLSTLPSSWMFVMYIMWTRLPFQILHACYRIFWFHLELIISVSLTQTFQHSVQTGVCSYVTYQKLCHIYFCSIFQTVTLSKMTWQICLRL